MGAQEPEEGARSVREEAAVRPPARRPDFEREVQRNCKELHAQGLSTPRGGDRRRFRSRCHPKAAAGRRCRGGGLGSRRGSSRWPYSEVLRSRQARHRSAAQRGGGRSYAAPVGSAGKPASEEVEVLLSCTCPGYVQAPKALMERILRLEDGWVNISWTPLLQGRPGARGETGSTRRTARRPPRRARRHLRQ